MSSRKRNKKQQVPDQGDPQAPGGLHLGTALGQAPSSLCALSQATSPSQSVYEKATYSVVFPDPNNSMVPDSANQDADNII